MENYKAKIVFIFLHNDTISETVVPNFRAFAKEAWEFRKMLDFSIIGLNVNNMSYMLHYFNPFEKSFRKRFVHSNTTILPDKLKHVKCLINCY